MRISDWSSDVCSSDLAGPAQSDHPGRTRRSGFHCAQPRRCQPPTAGIGIERAWLEPAPRSGNTVCLFGVRAGAAGHGYRLGPSDGGGRLSRLEEQTSELQSLMRISYAVVCLKKKTERSY